jgi:hypothetical protein
MLATGFLKVSVDDFEGLRECHTQMLMMGMDVASQIGE